MIDFLFTRWTFPSSLSMVIDFPCRILFGSIIGWYTGVLKEKYNLSVGYSRKIFHFTIFSLAGIIGVIDGFPAVQVFGAAIGLVVGYAVLRGAGSKLYIAVARPSDAPFERFYIVVPFLMTAPWRDDQQYLIRAICVDRVYHHRLG